MRRRGGFYNLTEDPPQSPVLWLDARRQAYSDPGGLTPASAFSGRVRNIACPPPGGAWLAPSDAARPFVDSNALDFQPGLGLSAPTAATLPANDCTIGISWTASNLLVPSAIGPLNDYVQGLLMGTHPGGSTPWGVCAYSDRVGVYYSGISLAYLWDTQASGGPTLKPGDLCSAVIRFTATGVDMAWNVNGATGAVSYAVAIPSATVTALGIGDRATRQLSSSVSQALAYYRAISDSERTQLLDHLARNRAPRFPTQTPLIAIAGDSIACGWGATLRSNSWAFRMMPNLYAAAPAKLLNAAFPGWTIPQVLADYPTSVAPFYSASRSKNICIAAAGTNDIYYGATGAAALTSYLALLAAIRATGWKIVACTLLPRTDAGAPVNQETYRQTFNTGLRAATSSYDSLADVALIAGMGGAGDSNNPTNYPDKVHPSDIGHALLEPTYRSATLPLLT